MSKTKKKSLAAEIGNLITAKAKFDSEDENEETTAKVVDFDEEVSDGEHQVSRSTLRRQNVQLLDKVDKRYAGKKVSRKDVFTKDWQSESEKSEISSNEDKSDPEESDPEESDLDEDLSNEEEELSEAENLEDENSADEEDEAANFNSMSRINIDEEIEKGNCVRNQIKVWENLLDLRIRLQKCLVASNRMPQLEVFDRFRKDVEFGKESRKVQNGLGELCEKLIKLDDLLGKTKENEQNDDEEILSEEDENDDDVNDNDDDDDDNDNDDEKDKEKQPKRKRKLRLSDLEAQIAKRHKAYVPTRNAEIQKWNDKVRIATSSSAKSQPILSQVEYILKDKARLLRRCQLKRSDYRILGKSEPKDEEGRRGEEYDRQIYDDDDFYHELLRELIHQRTSDITDPTQLSRQWVQLQSMRSKLKRKVDTRATKGRRLRFNVHQKLVNYMAPILVADKMSDQAKDELYRSLFGQGNRMLAKEPTQHHVSSET